MPIKHIQIEYSDNEGHVFTIRAPLNKEESFRATLAELGYHILNTTQYDCDYSTTIKLEYNK